MPRGSRLPSAVPTGRACGGRANERRPDCAAGAGHEVRAPARAQGGVVFASPHSGQRYPADLLASTRLDPVTLRASEDSFVDEIFAAAPAMGAPLLKAHFPRAYLDVNREPYELDPGMFEDGLPGYCNTRSPRVAAGLGTVARVVSHGVEIYARKLRAAEALERVERLYRPYHATLAGLVDEARDRTGSALVVDCHSMPSAGPDGRRGPDIVLGDGHGRACGARVIDAAARVLRERGYTVSLNAPYAGGFTTVHYGRPDEGVHALQIEINRALYMDERRMTRRPLIARLAGDMRALVAALLGLGPRAYAT